MRPIRTYATLYVGLSTGESSVHSLIDLIIDYMVEYTAMIGSAKNCKLYYMFT